MMRISYEKLWILLRQNKMKKKDLANAAGISSYIMRKLKNDQMVGMDVLIRCCKIFHCDIGDVMTIIEDD